MATKYRVLVVESARKHYNDIARILPEATYEVVCAHSTEEARKEVDYFSPALALVHYKLREKQAYHLCRELTEQGVTVIIIESSPTRRSVIKAARHGASAVLVEPLKPEDLQLRIHKTLVKSGKALPAPEDEPRMEIPAKLDNPRRRVEFVLKNVGTLLALPHAVAKVVQLCQLTHSGAHDLLKPIESDSALAGLGFSVGQLRGAGLRHTHHGPTDGHSASGGEGHHEHGPYAMRVSNVQPI